MKILGKQTLSYSSPLEFGCIFVIQIFYQLRKYRETAALILPIVVSLLSIHPCGYYKGT